MRIAFREDGNFYERLDKAVKRRHEVTISFQRARPDERSKLWPRLRRCQGWGAIAKELKDVQADKPSLIRDILARRMTVGLTGGEFLLIAWIAGLLAGVLFYAIYKNYKAKLRVDPKTGKGEIELDPT